MSFAYRDAAPLFANVDLHLGPGIAGLVGENGGGKSTLLRILGGELRPDAGSVLLRPEGARAILCPQAVEVRDERIPRFALDDGGEASRLRGRLRLDPGAIERWPTLSPGERKRWQIGAALAEEPALLLLDEPTNHLDAEARDVLLAALRRFRGIGVLVSHDRALLDALTTSTICVHQGRVTVHPGAYSEARAAWQREAEARGEARARAADEVHARARRLADERCRARASAEQTSPRGGG
ncbi:MAG: ATP-binding cassette domain-containing protein [Byssovorax sp.]